MTSCRNTGTILWGSSGGGRAANIWTGSYSRLTRRSGPCCLHWVIGAASASLCGAGDGASGLRKLLSGVSAGTSRSCRRQYQGSCKHSRTSVKVFAKPDAARSGSCCNLEPTASGNMGHPAVWKRPNKSDNLQARLGRLLEHSSASAVMSRFWPDLKAMGPLVGCASSENLERTQQGRRVWWMRI